MCALMSMVLVMMETTIGDITQTTIMVRIPITSPMCSFAIMEMRFQWIG